VERIDTVIRAVVRGLDEATGSSSPTRAKVLDICDHGARLLVRRRMALGQPLEVDLECELPLRVHLGFDADSLVIDGPMHTHLVRVAARVVRVECTPKRSWDIGVEFDANGSFHDLRAIQMYIDHLRETQSWAI